MDQCMHLAVLYSFSERRCDHRPEHWVVSDTVYHLRPIQSGHQPPLDSCSLRIFG